MRISDWSSDVCSSDLSIANFDPAVLPGAMGAWLEKGATFDGAVQPDVMGEALAGCFEYPPGVAVEFSEVRPNVPTPKLLESARDDGQPARATRIERKSGAKGKGGLVRVDLEGRRF